MTLLPFCITKQSVGKRTCHKARLANKSFPVILSKQNRAKSGSASSYTQVD